jgi:protein SCO1/2
VSRGRRHSAVVALTLLTLWASVAWGENTRPTALREVGIDQRLDAQVPLDATFRDENGRTVTLGQYLGSKPAILVLAYYECPMLCTLVLNGLTKALRVLSFDVGKEFDIVTVSFNPSDTPALAAQKKANYVADYGRPGAAEGWHFLTGDPASIERLAQSVGYRYTWIPEEKQFAHAAAIVVVTPAGRVSRYFFGVEFAPRDLRLGLIEASEHKIGSVVDALMLFCYRYDPVTGKYGAVAMNLIRIGGLLTVIMLGSYMVIMWRRDARSGGGVSPVGRRA